jgi:AsmA protein
MRIFRIIVIVAGALVALGVVALLAVLLFVDPDRYRGDIEKAAKEHTARVLSIRGKLELKVFPWLALSVHDVQLSNPAGFSAQPFMTVQKASIGVKLLPLLGKHLQVSRIALEGVNVNLISRGAQNNWRDLAESKPSGGSPSEGSASQGSVSIEGVDLGSSSIVYRDELKKSTTEIANLQLHTGPLVAGRDRTALTSLDLQGTYRTHSSEPSAAADSKPLAFSLRSSPLALAGETLAPVKIELRVGEAALLVSLAGEKMSTQRLLTGTVAVPPTSPRKLLQSLGITPPVTRDSRALSTFGLQTNFRLTSKQLQLATLQLALDDTRVQGTAALEDLDAAALGFDLNINAINVDRYRAPADRATAAVKGSRSPPPAKAPTPLPLETLRKLSAHGTLRVGSATFSNVLFTDLLIPLAARDGHIRLGPTEARLYGGSYNGDIVLDARPVQAQLSLNEHVHGTDIGALVKAAFDNARLSGRADADVAATGVGNTDDAMIRSLSGKIDANVKQGALNGIDLVYELQRVNALLKRQVPPQRTGAARTLFNALQTSGTLDKGVLRIDELRMETDFLKVRGRGTLETATEALDYRLLASVDKLPPGGSGAGGTGGGLDALGSVEVPLTITGTLSSPAVRPDIEALAKGKLGQEVQQKAGELVKKKLGDKLKDLFGR